MTEAERRRMLKAQYERKLKARIRAARKAADANRSGDDHQDDQGSDHVR